MSDNKTIEDLYMSTKNDLVELEKKNSVLSAEVDNIANSIRQLESFHSARMDEFNSSFQELDSMDTIVPTQERDSIKRELEAEKKKVEENNKVTFEKIQKEHQKKIEEINDLRSKIREARGRISVHERILKLRGVLK